MFILSIVLIFLVVCAIEYSPLFLIKSHPIKRSELSLLLTFFVCLGSSYIMTFLMDFEWISRETLTMSDFWVSLITSLIVSVSLRIIKYRKNIREIFNTESINKTIHVLVIIILLAIGLEIFVFNYRHYESAFNQTIDQYDLVVGAGLVSDGVKGYVAQAEGDKSLEIIGLDSELHNIWINLRHGDVKKTFVNVRIEAQDEGNSKYYTLTSRDVFNKVEKSQYFRTHLYGKVERLKLNVNVSAGETFYIDSLELNAQTPLFLSLVRFMTVTVILFMMYLLRPSSALYHFTFDMEVRFQRLSIGIFIMIYILVFWLLVQLNPTFIDVSIPHHKQYHLLTEALVKGQPYLDEVPSEELQKLSNPYDISLRSKTNTYYMWDQAYYNGKYYVYFGIGPVLFFYLPYYLIRGVHLPTYIGVFWSCIIAMIGIMGLLGAIIQRWFKRTPFVLYLILASYLINGCGLLYIAKRPDFYNITIALGLALSFVGLAAWLLASINEVPSKWLILFGSFCMAMVAACRPQMLLGSFLAFPIFYDAVFRNRTLFSKRSAWSSLFFFLPFVLVASGLMYYNAIRFGSVFDFGANYNLTLNDMTKRGWVFDRTFLGIIAYLFQPVSFQTDFPFFRVVGLHSYYIGHTIMENPIGGIFYTNLLSILSLLVWHLRRIFIDRSVLILSAMALLFGIVIVVVDTQMAGILMRYLSDFSWLILISAILVLLTINDHLKSQLGIKHWFIGIVICYWLSFGYHFLEIFIDVTCGLQSDNPLLTAMVSYLIQFWI